MAETPPAPAAKRAAAPPSGGGVTARAGRKYGPLALWQWLALVLAGLLAYEYYKSKKSASSTSASSTSATGTGTSSTSVPNNSTAFVFDAANYNFNNDQDNTPSAPPIQGGNPPRGGGPVPTGPLPPVGKPVPPVSKPAPPKNNTRTVTVGKWPAWNGSLWGIAEHEYGSGQQWQKIYNANKSIIGSNPNLIKPGQVLVIP
jgi:nucleoid-associated protein YgaU